MCIADLCDNSNTRRANKPMEEADFERVERDLQRQLHGLNIGATSHMPAMPYLGKFIADQILGDNNITSTTECD